MVSLAVSVGHVVVAVQYDAESSCGYGLRCDNVVIVEMRDTHNSCRMQCPYGQHTDKGGVCVFVGGCFLCVYIAYSYVQL